MRRSLHPSKAKADPARAPVRPPFAARSFGPGRPPEARDPETWLENARRFGHSLEKLSARPETARALPEPSVAPPPVPSAGPAGGAAPIQRMPKWMKKGLFGAEGLAGLGAMGLGGASLLGLTAAVSSPLLAGGLLVGGGLAAYHSYKGLTRDETPRDGNEITQQALDQLRSTHEDLSTRAKRDDLTSRESLLNDVLSETVPYLEDPRVSVEPVESGRSELAFPPPQPDDREQRRYGIRVNTNESNLPTHILHELTHISVDQKYRGNETIEEPENREEPYNLHDTRNMVATADRMDKEVGRIREIVARDRSLWRSQRKYIDERLDYAQKRPEVEYDTVMNELLYYLHLNQIGEDSTSSQAITKAARGAYQRRNEG